MDRFTLETICADEAHDLGALDSLGKKCPKATGHQGLDKTGDNYRILLGGELYGFIAIADGQATIHPIRETTDHLASSITPALAELIFNTGATSYSLSRSETGAETTVPVVFQREWATAQPVSVRDFNGSHADGVSALCRREGWQSYAEPEVARIGCSAPGVTTIVAENIETGTVAGFAQVLSDGVAQGYLAQLIIHPAYRRIGLARKLVGKSYEKSGAIRLDLLTDDAQAFYETFEGHAKQGYRIYPDR